VVGDIMLYVVLPQGIRAVIPPAAIVSGPWTMWTIESAPGILSAAISSKAIDSDLRATEGTCGGTWDPRPPLPTALK
jgi:hypothetical protein